MSELCEMLATKVGEYFNHPAPRITVGWERDMDLLITRGPLHQGKPTPIDAEAVREMIEWIFTDGAVASRNGFCWAAQIRSPHAIRDHWHQISAYRDRIVNRPVPKKIAPWIEELL